MNGVGPQVDDALPTNFVLGPLLRPGRAADVPEWETARRSSLGLEVLPLFPLLTSEPRSSVWAGYRVRFPAREARSHSCPEVVISRHPCDEFQLAPATHCGNVAAQPWTTPAPEAQDHHPILTSSMGHHLAPIPIPERCDAHRMCPRMPKTAP